MDLLERVRSLERKLRRLEEAVDVPEAARAGSDGAAEFTHTVRSFGLSESQRRQAWEAFQESRIGFLRLVEKAKTAQRPGAMLSALVRAGAHREDEQDGRRITGWRWVRGTHSGTYVRDPLGTDTLPEGYDLTTKAPWGAAPGRAPLKLLDEDLLTFEDWIERGRP